MQLGMGGNVSMLVLNGFPPVTMSPAIGKLYEIHTSMVHFH